MKHSEEQVLVAVLKTAALVFTWICMGKLEESEGMYF